MAPLQALLAVTVFSNVICSHAVAVHGASQSIAGRNSRAVGSNPVTVPNVTAAGEPVLRSFVSFSIEFAFFPDFAGNKSAPNVFSDNLLANLGALQGSKPDIRVGGNTQYVLCPSDY